MRQFDGKVIVKLMAGRREQDVLDTELYLNHEVAAEILRRYGVSIRVHIHEPVVA